MWSKAFMFFSGLGNRLYYPSWVVLSMKTLVKPKKGNTFLWFPSNLVRTFILISWDKIPIIKLWPVETSHDPSPLPWGLALELVFVFLTVQSFYIFLLCKSLILFTFLWYFLTKEIGIRYAFWVTHSNIFISLSLK